MKNRTIYIYITLALIATSFQTSAQCDTAKIFGNDSTHAACFELVNHVRKCYTNNIPDHQYGPFGGGNTIAGQDFDYSMCLYPELTTNKTELIQDTTSQGCGNGIIFGISTQGVNYSPFARLYFTNPNTNKENLNYIIEADFTLNMDLNGGHVNAINRYHYHNIPQDYFTNDLNINSSQHSPIVGYAADGFPIYYKYLYTDPQDATKGITSFQSSYRLKSGNRSGDGITAPNGQYDGTYVQDYEYVSTLSDLDECGGRFGVTPDHPNGTYYYVLTDNWPYIPRCLKGKYVDNSFRLGPNCPSSTAFVDCSTTPVNVSEIFGTEVEMKIYPNPATDHINISFTGNNNTLNKITGIDIYSLKGQKVYSAVNPSSTIKLNNIAKGIYFIQINFSNEQVTQKFVVQ